MFHFPNDAAPQNLQKLTCRQFNLTKFIFRPSAENIPEEKKQDVLLLFQKVGCYKDEILKHDLPDQATVKSVTQEDCVRSCAMEEKGYSYFGLQNADVCYCGHRYGKYGKADEALCNMPCKGNDKENCGGNSTNMVYFFGLGNYGLYAFTVILISSNVINIG